MGQIKLLLADDERIERSILYRKLSRELGEECEFIQAENGSEAVELFKEHHPQIAVLDIAMPELDGIEALLIPLRCVRMQNGLMARK